MWLPAVVGADSDEYQFAALGCFPTSPETGNETMALQGNPE